MGLLAIIVQNLPAIIDSAKGWFQNANPGAPLPTDTEIIEAYMDALASSLAKDEQWLSSHPELSGDGDNS